MVIHESSSDFIRVNFPKFFVFGQGGPALFKDQGGVIVPHTPNLSTYYTHYINPAIRKSLLFVAEEEGEVVGFSFADANLNDLYKLENKTISGAYTYVLPEHRRKGIATILRKKLFESIRAQGYKVIFCQIREENEASLASMESFFKEVPHTKYNGYKVEL